jgi:transmembrane sensor
MPTGRDRFEAHADPEAIEATAAVWLSLRDRGMTEDETAEFMRWLQQDSRHAEVFAELDETWKTFDQLAAKRPVEVVKSNHAALRPQRPGRRAVLVGGVLAVAATLVLAYLRPWYGSTPAHVVETAVGAFQKLDLPDGSTVQLNTDSAIDVRFTTTERRIHLARGEAFFTVAKNQAQPFLVAANGVDVQAVGTAFNVRLRAGAVDVLVTEGKVRVNRPAVPPGIGELAEVPARSSVSEVWVTAGERVVIPVGSAPATTESGPEVVKVAPLAVGRALAWQERRLEFEATALDEVVGEFNRYNRRRLVIADPRLAEKRFSGNFRADGYESFVRLLEENFQVMVRRSDEEIVLRLAP